MRAQTVWMCIPMYLNLCISYNLAEDDQTSCSVKDKFVDEYVLEVKQIHLHDVIIILEEDEFGLEYVENIIAELHLFLNRTKRKAMVSEEFVGKIKSRTQGRVKYFEQQCLKRLLLPITDNQMFQYNRKTGRALQSRQECRHNPFCSLGVYKAWEQGSSGKYVRILVVDIGVDYTNPDLKKNFNRSLCYDALTSAAGCAPHIEDIEQEHIEQGLIHHGTQSSGLIAGEKGNIICGDGVAYNATIGAVRIFNIIGETEDAYIAKGLSYKRHDVDIYSCSWGYETMAYNSFGKATQKTLMEGVKQGRNGKGSLFVFPSGNGGAITHCNNNGYARSVRTITIGSVGLDGNKASYTVMCPCVLTAVFGEGGEDDNSKLITTTCGIPKQEKECCTSSFKGSSVSAALASGIMALALEVNNNLTPRDIQHLLVRTSTWDTILSRAQWKKNGAGHNINDYFGFGLINAYEMVKRAKTWKQVNELHICNIMNAYFVSSKYGMIINLIKSDGCNKSSNEVLELEHVEVEIRFKTEFSDKLKIVLTSPMKTSSILMRRNLSKSEQNTTDKEITWILMSVQFWDENPVGTWELNLTVVSAFQETHIVLFIPALLTVNCVSLIQYGTTENEDKGDEKRPQETPQKEPESERRVAVLTLCFLSIFVIMCFIYILGCSRLKAAERESQEREALKTQTGCRKTDLIHTKTKDYGKRTIGTVRKR